MWAYIEGIELQLTRKEAHIASHQGQCDEDVRYVSQLPKVARQLRKLTPAQVRDALKPFGAWDETDLADHNQNLQRLVWVAAGQIVDEETANH